MLINKIKRRLELREKFNLRESDLNAKNKWKLIDWSKKLLRLST